MSSYFPFMLDVLGEILSRGSLFLLSIIIITHASRKVVQEEKELSSQTPESMFGDPIWQVLHVSTK